VLEPCLAQLPVLYRDAALLVVNKPSGMLVHRGWANDKITALSLAREIAGQWVYPVHRLDRSTSGVLVFALSPEMAACVQQSFLGDRVEKRYLALVRGLAPEQALIDHPIAKEKDKPKLPAQTRMLRLATYRIQDDLSSASRNYSWVEAHPLTGRPHQIRRHLKHLNHPIIGDVRYGKSEHNRVFRRRFALERLALHAESFSLPHPSAGTPLSISAPLPADLAHVLSALIALDLDASAQPAPAAGWPRPLTSAERLTGSAAALPPTELELATKT
jgi:tRNA pseudouridine65 synthase